MFLEKIIYKHCTKKKQLRENLLNLYLKYYRNDVIFLIEKYQLKRVNDKYILEINYYEQNSYNRQKIREEELLILNILLYTSNVEDRIGQLSASYDELQEYYHLENKIEIDLRGLREFYLSKFGDVEVKTNYQSFRIYMYEECAKNKHFRNTFIKEVIETHPVIATKLIEEHNLKLVKKEYINKEKLSTNGYYYNKIKNEEIEFIKKMGLIMEWMTFLKKYNTILYQTLIKEIDSETETKIYDFIMKNLI